ncbi:MAG: hypothetical protein WAX44_03145 [Minisyncoccia bacterium]
MQSEEKELLRRTIALEEENNEILRKMQRSMRFQRILSILYWVFIIGSLFGVYYFIQPYVEQILDVYSGARSSLDTGVGTVNSVIENLKNLTQ